jgi:hypothetical protein
MMFAGKSKPFGRRIASAVVSISRGGDDTRDRVVDEVLSRLADALVDDMLHAPDEELLGEFIDDQSRLAGEARQVFARALTQMGSPAAEVISLPVRKRAVQVDGMGSSHPREKRKYFIPFLVGMAVTVILLIGLTRAPALLPYLLWAAPTQASMPLLEDHRSASTGHEAIGAPAPASKISLEDQQPVSTDTNDIAAKSHMVLGIGASQALKGDFAAQQSHSTGSIAVATAPAPAPAPLASITGARSMGLMPPTAFGCETSRVGSSCNALPPGWQARYVSVEHARSWVGPPPERAYGGIVPELSTGSIPMK